MRVVLAVLCLLPLLGCAAPSARPGEASTVQVPELPGFAATAGTAAIPVTLHPPAGPGPFPTLVVLHACGGLRSQAEQASIARDVARFVPQGWLVAVPDSFTPRGIASVCAGPGPGGAGNLRQRADDAFSVLDYLVRSGLADPKRVVLLGRSHGAMVVLAVAGRDPPNGARFAGGVALYPGCTRARDVAHFPLLLLLAGRDDWTPADSCLAWQQLLAQLGNPVAAHVYPEALHGFDQPRPGPAVVLGHHLAYDAEATADAERRIDAFLAGLPR